MKATLFFTFIKDVHVYAPEDLGRQNILFLDNKIIAMGSALTPPTNLSTEIIDGSGKILVPGFIDSHVHLIGGGGEGGFATRTPEVNLSSITTSGVTTVVGCLGTDGVTRHVESLLAKARGLEDEGITAYIYTGSYEIPTPTITGSVRKDIILIDKVIGAGEIALSDHRSSQSARSEYRSLIAEARVGGMLSGKAGIVDMHVGDGKDGLKYLSIIAAKSELPKRQVLPTHINRNEALFLEGIAWAKAGGVIDITSGVRPKEGSSKAVKPSTAVKRALEEGVPLDAITMSSDGNGSVPRFDEKGITIGVGVATQKSMLEEVIDMIVEEKISITSAVSIVTKNVADILKLHTKGRIKEGMDADLLMLDEQTFELTDVFARGKHMVKDKKPIVFGTFEHN